MNIIDILKETNNNRLKELIYDFNIDLKDFDDFEMAKDDFDHNLYETYKNSYYEIVIEFSDAYIFYKNIRAFNKEKCYYYLTNSEEKYSEHGLLIDLIINTYDLIYKNILNKEKVNTYYWKNIKLN